MTRREKSDEIAIQRELEKLDRFSMKSHVRSDERRIFYDYFLTSIMAQMKEPR